MAFNDSLSDMLARIKNAHKANNLLPRVLNQS